MTDQDLLAELREAMARRGIEPDVALQRYDAPGPNRVPVHDRQTGEPLYYMGPAQRRLCAHADRDGEGMHFLAAGERCTKY